MSGSEKASSSKFPIWHHNMTVCYGDAEKAKYLRQQFPTSYLALSQQSFHAFQSGRSVFSQRVLSLEPLAILPKALCIAPFETLYMC